MQESVRRALFAGHLAVREARRQSHADAARDLLTTPLLLTKPLCCWLNLYAAKAVGAARRQIHADADSWK